MRPINMPWPQPGQKGVDFTPGLRYFSIARTITLPRQIRNSCLPTSRRVLKLRSARSKVSGVRGKNYLRLAPHAFTEIRISPAFVPHSGTTRRQVLRNSSTNLS
jgi:hypothetical protein